MLISSTMHTVVNVNWIILSLVLVILDYNHEIRMTQEFDVGNQKHQNVFVLDFANCILLVRRLSTCTL